MKGYSHGNFSAKTHSKLEPCTKAIKSGKTYTAISGKTSTKTSEEIVFNSESILKP